jgi:hypothetical protein
MSHRFIAADFFKKLAGFSRQIPLIRKCINGSGQNIPATFSRSVMHGFFPYN